MECLHLWEEGGNFLLMLLCVLRNTHGRVTGWVRELLNKVNVRYSVPTSTSQGPILEGLVRKAQQTGAALCQYVEATFNLSLEC